MSVICRFVFLKCEISFGSRVRSRQIFIFSIRKFILSGRALLFHFDLKREVLTPAFIEGDMMVGGTGSCSFNIFRER